MEGSGGDQDAGPSVDSDLLTRRNFLKFSGLGFAGVAVSSLLPDIFWFENDVVENLFSSAAAQSSSDISELRLSGGNEADPANYILEASGLEKVSGSGSVFGEKAVGSLTGGTHIYSFDLLKRFNAESGITITDGNGDEVDKEDILAVTQCETSDNKDEDVDPSSDDVLDVTNYGAVGDGSSDDTSAIQEALKDASAGDTIYLPEGEYLINNGTDKNSFFDLDPSVSDLTIRGEPEYGTSKIVVDKNSFNGSNAYFAVFRLDLGAGVYSGLHIHDLTIDCNHENYGSPFGGNNDRVGGIVGYPDGAGGGHEILVEDVHVENATAIVIGFREGGYITVRRCTVIDSIQGMNLSERNDWSNDIARDYGGLFEACVVKNSEGVGIDHNQGGVLKIKDCYSENNGNSFFKSTKDNRRTIVENCTSYKDQFNSQIRTNISTAADLPDPPLIIELNKVAIRNANGAGIYMSGDTSSSYQNSSLKGGPIEIRNVDGSQNPGDSAIDIMSRAGADIGDLRVVGTSGGAGFNSISDYGVNIDTYYHQGNDNGAYGRTDNLDVKNRVNGDPGRLDTPEEGDVGAWSS